MQTIKTNYRRIFILLAVLCSFVLFAFTVFADYEPVDSNALDVNNHYHDGVYYKGTSDRLIELPSYNTYFGTEGKYKFFDYGRNLNTGNYSCCYYALMSVTGNPAYFVITKTGQYTDYAMQVYDNGGNVLDCAWSYVAFNVNGSTGAISGVGGSANPQIVTITGKSLDVTGIPGSSIVGTNQVVVRDYLYNQLPIMYTGKTAWYYSIYAQYADRDNEFYNQGWVDGRKSINLDEYVEEGYQDGYAKGVAYVQSHPNSYSLYTTAQYNSAVSNAYSQAVEDTASDVFQTAYDNGYANGYIDAESLGGIGGALGGFFGGITEVLQEFFSLDIGGVRIGNIINALLVFLAIFAMLALILFVFRG